MNMFQAWLDRLAGGAVVPVFLTLLCAVALVVIIERWIVHRAARTYVGEFLSRLRKTLLINKSLRDSIETCDCCGGFLPAIMKAGLLKYGQPREEVEASFRMAAIYHVTRLRKRLLLLKSITSAAPLIGIVGTLSGFIDVFARFGREDPMDTAAASQMIAIALVDTVVGISIAAVTLLARNYFIGNIQGLTTDSEIGWNMLLETFGEMERAGVTTDSAGG